MGQKGLFLLLVFSFLIAESSFAVLQRKKALNYSAPRTVMVQLFEWPWNDVAKECTLYLGPNGFSAVQVSPVTEHMMWDFDPWWTRYQPVSYNINSRSGTEQEFRNMVNTCKSAGVDVYVDVVLNHMAGLDNGFGYNGTRFTHYDYPGLWQYGDFNHCGRNDNDNILNYYDRYELWFCELVNLADLKTEAPNVRQKLADFLNRLLDMGVSGFRIDAAKHMPPDDINAIVRLLRKPAYVYQELIVTPGEPIRAEDYLKNGDVLVFGYAFDIGRGFKHRDMGRLQNIGKVSGYPRSEDVVVFVDDHDLQRRRDVFPEVLTYQTDAQYYRLANVFMLAWPYGYPRVFSGYMFDNYDQGPPTDEYRKTKSVFSGMYNNCQAPWICEHRMREVGAMVTFRNVANQNFYYTDWWSNGVDQVSFGRGDAGFVVINASSTPLVRTFSTSMKMGRYCNILDPQFDFRQSTCRSATVGVDSQGNAQVSVPPMSAIAIHVGAPAPF